MDRNSTLLPLCFLLLSAPLQAEPRRQDFERRFGDLPLRFEPNVGQADDAVQFLARGAGYALSLTPSRATVRAGSTLQIEFVGADPAARAEGREPQASPSHYLVGNRWHTDVHTFGRVVYREVYTGIDVTYYGRQSRLEYDFLLEPHADAGRIRVAFSGVEVAIGSEGDLILQTVKGEFRQTRPRVYQRRGAATVEVRGAYVLTGPGEVGFELGEYDHDLPLVIDPVLIYSSYLGGSGDDSITSMAVDAAGNIYVAGWTSSADFPVANGDQGSAGGGVDAFVAKLNPSGTALLYATYLGGRYEDRAFGIAVDLSGSAVVTGWTYSPTFPTVNAIQSTLAGGRNAFVTKLNAAGNGLLFSTFLGGGGHDGGNGVALDPQGNIYVVGDTTSTNFPTLNPFKAANAGQQDVFLAKLSPTGTLLYSTYLGGTADDHAGGVAVDSTGSAYLTGSTNSANFPVVNPYQNISGGGQDAFAAKFNAAGSALVYSTYIGGSGGGIGRPEMGNAIAVDSSGNAYIAGTTSSANFPVMNAFQGQMGGGSTDAFVIKLNVFGSAPVYSTYLGGVGSDNATAIAIDAAGSAYVAGYTTSTDFPVATPIQSHNAGMFNAFVVVLAPAGNAITFGSYLGGEASDAAYAIAVDAATNIYLAGQTLSYTFPSVSPLEVINAGGYGGFVVKIRQPQVTIASSRPGTAFTVSGTGCSAGSYSTPATLSWITGSTCTVTMSVPTGYGFTSWDDGPTQSPRTYATPAGNTTIAAILSQLNCTCGLSPASQNLNALPASGSVNVSVLSNCTWGASAGAAWLTIIGGATGNGNGTVTYSAAANPGSARSGTLTIGGQTFTVNQAAAVDAAPTVNIDTPAYGATVVGTVNVSGWAIDTALPGTAMSPARIYVDGILVANTTYGMARPDVCGVYPSRPGCPNVGFTYALDTSKLTAGSHRIGVVAADTDTAPDSAFSEVPVTVIIAVAAPPLVTIDTPANGATVAGTVNVSGWAVDSATGPGVPVNTVAVYVDGVLQGNAAYGSSRPDVCNFYTNRPGCPNVGYAYALDTPKLTAGSHRIRVVATDSDPSPDSALAETQVTVSAVVAVPPVVTIDTPANGATIWGTATVSGWAIDTATAPGTAINTVAVYVDGVLQGNAAYGVSRPDVCAAYPGRPGCPKVGFTYALDTTRLTLGSHRIRVVATDSDTSPDSALSEVQVTVTVAPPPAVAIDTPANGSSIAGIANVSGWALDNATAPGTAINSVAIYLDGVFQSNATYGISRPDVCAVYPGRPGCLGVGFFYNLDTTNLAPGSHRIRAVATDSDGTPDSAFAEVVVNR